MRFPIQLAIAVATFLLAYAPVFADHPGGWLDRAGTVEINEANALAFLGMGGTALGVIYLSARTGRNNRSVHHLRRLRPRRHVAANEQLTPKSA